MIEYQYLKCEKIKTISAVKEMGTIGPLKHS